MIYAEGLRKRYGAKDALAGVDLSVPAGTVCGLLGPNGAGKTTAVRILTTLLRPDAGHAEVAGLDVVRDADRLRFMVGLAGQHAAVDELLTGRRNLEMFGRLYHLPKATARRRAEELLERFDLTDAANRPVKTYSGGMRRRLDVAASLIVSPPVLFMDEPTTGLDPRSRLGLWELLRGLVSEGTTLLLTTQYLDEADRLADQIVVLDQGRVAAAGSPAELKQRIGGDRVQVVFQDSADVPKGLDLVRRAAGQGSAAGQAEGRDPQAVVVDGRQVTAAVEHGAQSLIHIAGALDAAMLPIEDLSLRRPTLDEVFLHLTAT